MTLALFDLDHTLLSGDSDVLWCDFLVRHGQLPASRLAQSAQMEADYRAGSVGVADFCNFYMSTLAGRSLDDWQPWLQRFLHDEVLPRIPGDAWALLAHHRRLGHRLLLTTATNRVITTLTAGALAIDDLIATEAEQVDGRFTGRTAGVPNMREGKPRRLQAWLAAQGLPASALADAWAYSDSINDLPLLSAVGHPTVVDPDPRLLAQAQQRGWPLRRFDRG